MTCYNPLTKRTLIIAFAIRPVLAATMLAGSVKCLFVNEVPDSVRIVIERLYITFITIAALEVAVVYARESMVIANVRLRTAALRHFILLDALNHFIWAIGLLVIAFGRSKGLRSEQVWIIGVAVATGVVRWGMYLYGRRQYSVDTISYELAKVKKDVLRPVLKLSGHSIFLRNEVAARRLGIDLNQGSPVPPHEE